VVPTGFRASQAILDQAPASMSMLVRLTPLSPAGRVAALDISSPMLEEGQSFPTPTWLRSCPRRYRRSLDLRAYCGFIRATDALPVLPPT
jgi:hypothetical protein